MKKIKDRILFYLQDKDWTDKEEICSQISYLAGCYGETVGRMLRDLQRSGKIRKLQVQGKRGTKYRIAEKTKSNYEQLINTAKNNSKSPNTLF